MRSRIRERQNIWFSTVTEKRDGVDTIKEYSAPVKKRYTVSATSGTPEEISAGIVPNYDRYITCYDRLFKAVEGMALWVDKVPETDEDGNLILENDSPTVPPDYRLTKIIDTSKGLVARFGISKIGDSNG